MMDIDKVSLDYKLDSLISDITDLNHSVRGSLKLGINFSYEVSVKLKKIEEELKQIKLLQNK